MRRPAAAPLGLAGWLFSPLVVAGLASFAFAAPARLFGLSLPEPVFACAPAFAWALRRPSLLAPLALAALGLGLDWLWRTPIGFWPTCLTAAYAAGLFPGGLLAAGGLAMAFGGYAIACAAALAVGLLLTYARSGQWADPLSVLWQFLATAAVFPFAWRLIRRYEAGDGRAL